MSNLSKISLIFLNVIFWMIIFWIGTGLTWNIPPFSTSDGTFYKPMLWGNVINMIIFYGNVFVLFPLFFRMNSKWKYVVLSILFVFVCSVIEGSIDRWLAISQGLSDRMIDIFNGVVPASVQIFGFTIQDSLINFFFFFLSFALIFPLESIRNTRQREGLEKEKMQAELNFLRAQINPHFLFNGINSIYHLIDTDATKAKSTLLNFSDLLRYQLYECNEAEVPLQKELKSMSDYISLELTRRSGEMEIDHHFDVENEHLKIAPLLFLPFLENAFKYLSTHDEAKENRMHMRLVEKNGMINFRLSNTIRKDDQRQIGSGGIGLENVQKRLQFLYPGQYKLNIVGGEIEFMVALELQLKINK